MSETFDYLQNNSLSRAQLSDVPTEFYNIHYGDVLIRYSEVFDASADEPTYIKDDSMLSKMPSSLLRNGDIVMADAAEDETVGKCCEIAGLQGNKAVSGLHTIPLRPKEKHAVGFLGYYMNSNSYHNQLLPIMQGTKVSSISKSAISETIISAPASIEEQEKIGTYLRKLDNLITLHQRNLFVIEKPFC